MGVSNTRISRSGDGKGSRKGLTRSLLLLPISPSAMALQIPSAGVAPHWNGSLSQNAPTPPMKWYFARAF